MVALIIVQALTCLTVEGAPLNKVKFWMKPEGRIGEAGKDFTGECDTVVKLTSPENSWNGAESDYLPTHFCIRAMVWLYEMRSIDVVTSTAIAMQPYEWWSEKNNVLIRLKR